MTTPRPPCRPSDPPAPVKVVELPKPLPLPGQLKPVGKDGKPEPEAADPTVRVNQANAAARMQPVRNGFINSMQVYPFVDGALYQVYSSPGEITDIALQPGEQLVGSGPVAAGDTVRWIIGDTESGTARRQAGPYPRQADAAGADDQPRHQHRPAHLSHGTALDRKDLHGLGILAISAGPAHRAAPPERRGAGRAACRPRASTSPASISATTSTGDRAPWRPLRAFDDGKQVFIEFPRGIGQGEMPPLFVVGPEGDTSELVNYRVRGNYMIVDRLFAAAELRFGAGEESEARAHLPHRWEASVVTSELDPEKGKGPEPAER